MQMRLQPCEIWPNKITVATSRKSHAVSKPETHTLQMTPDDFVKVIGQYAMGKMGLGGGEWDVQVKLNSVEGELQLVTVVLKKEVLH